MKFHCKTPKKPKDNSSKKMLYLNSNLEESLSGTSKISDKYVITTDVLGIGSYAKVYRGHMKANPNIQIAIKEIELSGKINNPKFVQTLDREINILRRFNHPNIIQLYDVVRLPDKMFIFLEICEDGDLKKLILGQKQKIFPEKHVLLIMTQIIEAFKVMYENNVIHRDLKPANILIQKNTYKISDFGFAREIFCGMDEPAALTRYGSPLYMCPQILKGTPFSSKCDVWSLGIIAFQMLYGKTPWIGMSPPDLLNNIEKNPKLKFNEEIIVSEGMKEIITKMLVWEDQMRISWPELFKLELFRNEKSSDKLSLKGNDVPNFGKKEEEKSFSKKVKKGFCCCFGG